MLSKGFLISKYFFPIQAGYIERLDEKILIKKGINIIGREHCHIVIPHEALSAKHALIYAESAEKHTIVDLKSTNGTLVNDALITDNQFYPLNDGDKISFGGYDVFYFKSACDGDAIFEESTENFLIPETPPNGLKTKNNQSANDSIVIDESCTSNSFIDDKLDEKFNENVEDESSLKNNSDASFNLLLEETYNFEASSLNSTAASSQKKVDESLCTENCEASKKDTVENLCTQICEPDKSDVYAGKPRELNAEETLPNESVDETEAETLIVENNELASDDVHKISKSLENEKHVQQLEEKDSLLEVEDSSIKPQVYVKKSPIKICTEVPLKNKITPSSSRLEFNENENIESLCTQIYEPDKKEVYAGEPRKFDADIGDETLPNESVDETEAETLLIENNELASDEVPDEISKSENENHVTQLKVEDFLEDYDDDESLLQTDHCSLPPTQILPRKFPIKLCTRQPIKHNKPSNNSTNSDISCSVANVVENNTTNHAHEPLGSSDEIEAETLLIENNELASDDIHKISKSSETDKNVQQLEEEDTVLVVDDSSIKTQVYVKKSPIKICTRTPLKNKITPSCSRLEFNENENIESLCTQICEPDKTAVYAGEPRQFDADIGDETLPNESVDETEAETLLIGNNELAPDEVSKSSENEKHVPQLKLEDNLEDYDDDESLLQADHCSLPPTQILPRKFPIKLCTRQPIKHNKPSNNSTNSDISCAVANVVENNTTNHADECLGYSDDMEAETLLIENNELATDEVSDKISESSETEKHVQQLEDKDALLVEDDSSIKTQVYVKKSPITICTRTPLKNKITPSCSRLEFNENENIESLCTQICEPDKTAVYAGIPQETDVDFADETFVMEDSNSEPKKSETDEKSLPSLKQVVNDDESLLQTDHCSLPPTQILPRKFPIKLCTRQPIKHNKPSNNSTNSDISCAVANVVENNSTNHANERLGYSDDMEAETLLIENELASDKISKSSETENYVQKLEEKDSLIEVDDSSIKTQVYVKKSPIKICTRIPLKNKITPSCSRLQFNENENIESLCTQICEPDEKDVYAGKPRKFDANTADETLPNEYVDETEAEILLIENNKLASDEISKSSEIEKHIQQLEDTPEGDESLPETDHCSLPATQILPRKFPPKHCTRQPIKHKKPSNNSMNSDISCALDSNIQTVEVCTRVPLKNKILPQSTKLESDEKEDIENLSTQICEPDKTAVYAGIPQETDVDFAEETLVIEENDNGEFKKSETDEKSLPFPKEVVNDDDESLLQTDHCSLPPTQILPRKFPMKRCTRQPIKLKKPSNNSSNADISCAATNVLKDNTSIHAVAPSDDMELETLVIEENKLASDGHNQVSSSADIDKDAKNMKDAQQFEDDDFSLQTQVYQREMPVKVCTRVPLKRKILISPERTVETMSQIQEFVSKNKSQSSPKKKETEVEDLRNDLLTQAIFLKPSSSPNQARGSSSVIGNTNEFDPDEIPASPEQTVETMSQIQDFVNKNRTQSTSKKKETEVEDLKNDLLTQAIFLKPSSVLNQAGGSSSVIDNPNEFGPDEIPSSPERTVETMSQIQDFVSKNKNRTQSTPKKRETEVEDLKNDLLTQAIFLKPSSAPNQARGSSSAIENPNEFGPDEIPASPERAVETMSQIQDFVSKNKNRTQSTPKKRETEVEDLKNDLLTQAIFLKPSSAPNRVRASSSAIENPDEIPASPERTAETMSQIQEFLSKNKNRTQSTQKKRETEIVDLKNDLLTQQAIVLNPGSSANQIKSSSSVMENRVECEVISNEPKRKRKCVPSWKVKENEEISYKTRSRKNYKSLPSTSSEAPCQKTKLSATGAKQSVFVEEGISSNEDDSSPEVVITCKNDKNSNSKSKLLVKRGSMKNKLSSGSVSKDEVPEKPPQRRGRPKKVIVDDEDPDSAPEIEMIKKTRGKRKVEDSFDNTNGTKYPKLEVERTSTNDMDLDIADMIKMRKRSASTRPSSIHPGPSDLDKFKYQNVIFTFVKNVDLQQKVEKLGGTIGTNSSECTVLVTEEVKRSVKFLCVLGRGKPIVTPKWIHDSSEARAFLDPMKYVLKDSKKEKLYSFQLESSLKKARESPLLKGVSIFVTPSVKPPPSEMKEIVESCGGRFLVKAPLKWPSKSIVISCFDDEVIYKKWKSRSKPFPIIEAEGLITAILQQNLSYNNYLL